MNEDRDPIPRYRDRLLAEVYGRLVAAAHRVRKTYRASFSDLDLTVDDLSQIGALRAMERFDWLMEKDAERFLSVPPENLRRYLTRHATEAMAWHVIDTYRQRDRRRSAIAPDELLAVVDDTLTQRVALWRRIEPVMAELSSRQRVIVQGLWDGVDAEEISERLGVSQNVVHKDLAGIRRLAA